MLDQKKTGMFITDMRKEKGLTQKQLAESIEDYSGKAENNMVELIRDKGKTAQTLELTYLRTSEARTRTIKNAIFTAVNTRRYLPLFSLYSLL